MENRDFAAENKVHIRLKLMRILCRVALQSQSVILHRQLQVLQHMYSSMGRVGRMRMHVQDRSRCITPV